MEIEGGERMPQDENRRSSKRQVQVPDFRKETKRQYMYANRPYQKDYLKDTHWDKTTREQEQERPKKEPKQKNSNRKNGNPQNYTKQTQQNRSVVGELESRKKKKKRVGQSSKVAENNTKKTQMTQNRAVPANKNGKSGKKGKNRKKKSGFFGWGFVVMCLIAIGLGSFLGRTKAQMNQILNQRKQASLDLTEVKIDESKLGSDSNIVNILLVGSDKRETWSEQGRSDCVMVATIDKKHRCLKLTSLMRDMYIDIPNHGKAKFNAAYSYGGIELLYKTIAYNFDLKLDGYALVDFAAFKQVVKEIGGVDIELTEAEANYLRTAYHRGSVLKVQPGLHTLNGAQALAYTRIRQDIRADFGRTERQRKVVQAVFKKAKSKSYSKLLDMVKVVMPNITTDLTNDEIYGYMTDMISMGTTDIQQYRIPVDNSYDSQRINGQLVLVPNVEQNKEKLQEFIFQSNGEVE